MPSSEVGCLSLSHCIGVWVYFRMRWGQRASMHLSSGLEPTICFACGCLQAGIRNSLSMRVPNLCLSHDWLITFRYWGLPKQLQPYHKIIPWLWTWQNGWSWRITLRNHGMLNISASLLSKVCSVLKLAGHSKLSRKNKCELPKQRTEVCQHCGYCNILYSYIIFKVHWTTTCTKLYAFFQNWHYCYCQLLFSKSKKTIIQ